jgi:hypothetical protein
MEFHKVLSINLQRIGHYYLHANDGNFSKKKCSENTYIGNLNYKIFFNFDCLKLNR